jgi:hypothetical protein
LAVNGRSGPSNSFRPASANVASRSRLGGRCLAALVLLSPVAAFPASSAAPLPPADARYLQVTTDRADKIIAPLSLADPAKATRVRDEIAQFYRDLNALQGSRDAAVSAAKKDAASKESRDAAVKAAQADADAKRESIRQDFLKQLSGDLTSEQIDRVKDGLTYGTLGVTFRAYEKLYPNLTPEQKDQIHAWLVEAREHAIAGFTSDEKHAWFNKYKGRINNYLSKAGYKLK